MQDGIQHNAATVTVEVLKTNKGTQDKHPNDVDFIVKYPEGWTGQRFMPEGKVVVSKEAAEKFTSQGIGSVAGSESELPSEDPTPEEKNYNSMNMEQLKALLAEREISFPNKAKKDELIALLTESDLTSEGSESKAAVD